MVAAGTLIARLLAKFTKNDPVFVSPNSDVMFGGSIVTDPDNPSKSILLLNETPGSITVRYTPPDNAVEHDNVLHNTPAVPESPIAEKKPTWDDLYPNQDDRITTGSFVSTQFIIVDYTNHRGSRSLRQIRPVFIFTGYSEYHSKDSIFLHCIDDQTGMERDFSFAFHAIHPWNEELFDIMSQFNEYSKKGYMWFPKPLMDRLNALLYVSDISNIELPAVHEIVSLNATIQSMVNDMQISSNVNPEFKEGVKASVVAILKTCIGQGIAFSQIPLVISIVGSMISKINDDEFKPSDLNIDELLESIKTFLKS